MGDTTPTYDIFELFGDWRGPAIGLMDLDAFFASVEQLDHPEWRGKPVIVGGLPEERGVVSTASYEARPFGVHSAMPSAQAMRLCPHAIWTHGHFDRYREMSAKVMAIFATVLFGPKPIEQVIPSSLTRLWIRRAMSMGFSREKRPGVMSKNASSIET